MSDDRVFISTDKTPAESAALVDDFTPSLITQANHHLCPGCGEPIAIRAAMEAIEELELAQSTITVFGIGCYTAFAHNLDVEVVQALHGRAPSVATGIKRMLPDGFVMTIQGDGDMVNEGLQEVLHTAARGENITCLLLNNGVFGETGGQMTTTTTLGQRTKTSIEGRDPHQHGHPILLSDLAATMDGAAYVARCAVNNAGNVARTKRYITKAYESQMTGAGFSLVEILTMCPTGWFVDTLEGPDYLQDTLAPVHNIGELKTP